MGILNELAAPVKLPRMYRVRQKFPEEHLSSGELAILLQRELHRETITSSIRPGMRIAVTCGSRGISSIALITKIIVNFVKERGGFPFIVPAMGSHGGATAAGQRRIVESFGITEQTMGCPIFSTMEVTRIGSGQDGRGIYMDRFAAEADGIIVVNRIKPHTAFRGPYESGLMKMTVIGLGKQVGAEICHKTGFSHMARDLEDFGRAILSRGKVLFGVAILENPGEQTIKTAVLTPEEIITQEPVLLKEAKANMPRICFDHLDVLIVDQIGKNISGDGMDPNITGRFGSPEADPGTCIKTKKIVVLDLTGETHGSALGIGMADVTTRRLFDKTIFEMTYPNAITSTVLEQVRMPMVIGSDKEAIQLALKTCLETDFKNPRIVRIRDTQSLGEILISEALLGEAHINPMTEVLGEGEEFPFDDKGNLWQER